jgi:tetratricopeptide (TPR) repeat protein
MNPRVREVLAVAEQQLKTGRFEDAAKSFGQAKQLCPKVSHIDARLSLALIYARQISEAIQVLRNALRQHPADISLYLHLGNAYTHYDSMEMAEETFLKGLALYNTGFNTARAFMCRHLGDIYLAQEKFIKAEDCYQEALLLKPTMADAYNSLGIVHRLMLRYQEAITCFEKALLLRRPVNIEALHNLASTCEIIGDRQRSRQLYGQLLLIQPELVTSINGKKN